MIPTQGKEDHQIYFQSAFPLISTIFGLHVNVMITHLIEIGCLRRLRGQTQVSKNGFEGFSELVNDRHTFEKTANTLDGFRYAHLLNLDNAGKSPIEA